MLAVVSISVLLASSVVTALTAITPVQALAVPTNQKDCVAAGGQWESVNRSGADQTCQITIAETFTPDQEATSYSYYVALSGCVQNNMGHSGSGSFPVEISENGDATTAEMFDDNQAFGYVYPGGTKTDCKDIMSESLSLWGWTGSTQTFLEAMGYTYSANASTGQPMYNGTDDGSVRVKNFQSAVQTQVYSGNSPSLSGQATYDVDFNAFTQNGGACQANDLGLYSSLGSTEKKYVDAGSVVTTSPPGRTKTTVTYAKLPMVNQTTGASVDHGYTYSYTVFAGAGGSTADQVTLYGYHATPKTATCEQLVAGIKKNAAAYQAWVKTHTTKDTSDQNLCKTDPTAAGCQTTATSCNIDQIGWLLCPLLTTGAHLADSAYGFLADNFLATNPSLLNTDPKATTTDDSGDKVAIGTGTYTAWKIMLTIANVAFIIAFLIIIFSQLTSVGVTNYGVKKLLPRLIVVAILVNVSFWVCAIAVDVSNILGYSLKDVLTSVANQVATSGGGTAVDTGDQSGNLFGIVTTVITVGAIAWVNLGAVFVAIVGALITLLIIFVLLAARQALIVLLVVIAPLAFVAYLLPNTESLFKKWRTMFTSLLLLFPIIGVLYGACLLASEILKQVASSNVIMQIMAYVALVVPLIAVIPLLKGSLDGVGKIGANIQSFGSKARGAAGKKTQKTFDNSRLGKFRGYRTARWSQRRDAIQGGTYQGAGGKANPLNWLTGGNRGANRISGRFGNRLEGQGAAIAAKEDSELLGNAGARLETMNLEGKPLSQDQLIQIAKRQDITHDGTASGRVLAGARSFDEYSRRAAIERAGKTATVAQAHDLVDASTGMSIAERKALAGSLVGSNAAAKAPYLGGRTLAEITQGTANSDNAALAAIQTGKITAEALAGGDKDSVAKLVDVATKTPPGSQERAALRAAYAELSKPDSRLREHIVAGGAHDVALQGIKSL